MRPLRLVVFDATQLRRAPRALGLSWRAGAELYLRLGWIDGFYGTRSFAEGLDWAANFQADRPLGELQYWGHGKWGRALVDRESLDRSALSAHHPLNAKLRALRERLAPDSLIWFRTCETLGARDGQDFAAALSEFTGADVAGHTFVIGFFQSGLHRLRAGDRPHWPAEEGLALGTPAEPRAALPSGPSRPNTVTCFTHAVPGELA